MSGEGASGDVPGVLCPLTTHAALTRAAAIAPDVEAIVGPGGRLTYGQLEGEVACIRGALKAHGVVHGEHVGICAGNGPRWMALFLALGSLGAVVVPINTRLRADEIAHMLGHGRVQTLFVAERLLGIDFMALLGAIEPGIIRRHAGGLPGAALPALHRVVTLGADWDAFLAAGRPAPPACAPDDTLLIQYTSGTTSRPKGVRLRHRSMLGNGFVSGGRMGLRIADRFHSARPFFHVAGTSLSILACVQHAATLVTMERFEPAEALALMEAERCTHFSGNDTMALMLLNHPDRARRRLALRGAWVAASPAILRRVIDELGARETVAGYGLSEASPNVAQSCWWEEDAVRAAALMRPQPGVEVRIAGTGEIQVRGYTVMEGYLDDKVATEAAIDGEGWLATGDLGALDADGRLSFLGRLKDLIRVGGENVSPAEVEDVLHRHPAVRQAVVVGVPDARLMEVPCAFVVLNEGHAWEPGAEQAAAIAAWGRARMAGFKAPRYVQVVDGFEHIGMTASSKVQKARLRAHAIQLLGLD